MFTASAHSQPSAPDKDNEDWHAITPDLAVVLDGATIRTGTGCSHGLPWFVSNLGAQLIGAASDPTTTLTDAIRTAISAVADMHSGTCDLTHPGSPSAAIGLVRRNPAGVMDYAVLGDISILFSLADHDDAFVVTDPRVSQVGEAQRRECDQWPIGSDEKTAAMQKMKKLELAGRNVEGGYWIASVVPEAADHALVGSVPTDQVERLALCSDGAMRAIEMTSVQTPTGILGTLRSIGPEPLIASVRASEHRDPTGVRWPRNKASDDATIIFVEATETRRQNPPTPERQKAALQLLPMLNRKVMGEYTH